MIDWYRSKCEWHTRIRHCSLISCDSSVAGTKPEHFAKVAYKNHKHSVNNPWVLRLQFSLFNLFILLCSFQEVTVQERIQLGRNPQRTNHSFASDQTAVLVSCLINASILRKTRLRLLVPNEKKQLRSKSVLRDVVVRKATDWPKVSLGNVRKDIQLKAPPKVSQASTDQVSTLGK